MKKMGRYKKIIWKKKIDNWGTRKGERRKIIERNDIKYATCLGILSCRKMHAQWHTWKVFKTCEVQKDEGVLASCFLLGLRSVFVCPFENGSHPSFSTSWAIPNRPKDRPQHLHCSATILIDWLDVFKIEPFLSWKRMIYFYICIKAFFKEKVVSSHLSSSFIFIQLVYIPCSHTYVNDEFKTFIESSAV